MKEWFHQLLISLPGVPVVAGGPGQPRQPECTAAEDEDAQKMNDPAGIIMLEDQEGSEKRISAHCCHPQPELVGAEHLTAEGHSACTCTDYYLSDYRAGCCCG